jgi:hypothetical protein
VEQAHRWAHNLLAGNAKSPRERITTMYETAFARPPSEAELADAETFLQQQGELLALSASAWLTDERVWADLCHVLFNVKEFIFIN